MKNVTKKDLYVAVIVAIVLSIAGSVLVVQLMGGSNLNVGLSPTNTGITGPNGNYYKGYGAKFSGDNVGAIGIVASKDGGAVISSHMLSNSATKNSLILDAKEVNVSGDLNVNGENVATNQGVLNMLRTYDVGNCKFYEEPTGSLLDPQDDDYLGYTQPFINADTNGDGVTTGVEWCESREDTCITGYNLVWISTTDYSGYMMSNPIGCGGGNSIETLRGNIRPPHNTFLCCSP